MTKLLFIFILTLLCGCSASRRPDGFYRISDSPRENIVGKAIVPVDDFGTCVIDSMDGMLFIQGKLKPEARVRFAEATEKLIGHRIGFVFSDSIVMAPQINCRIDSGNFQII